MGDDGKNERTKSQHRLIYLAGRLLAQEPRVVALDGEERHDACRRKTRC